MTRPFKCFVSALLLAFVVLSIPAIFTFATSVWMAEVTADGKHRDNALAILAEDVWYAQNRLVRQSGLVDQPPRPQPVFVVDFEKDPVKLILPVALPSCSPPEYILDPAQLRLRRIQGYPFNIRLREEQDTRNLIFARRLGVWRLAALRSCLSATPFANRCGAWLSTQSVDEASVIAALMTKGLIEKSGAGFCWRQAEVAGPAATH